MIEIFSFICCVNGIFYMLLVLVIIDLGVEFKGWKFQVRYILGIYGFLVMVSLLYGEMYRKLKNLVIDNDYYIFLIKEGKRLGERVYRNLGWKG